MAMHVEILERPTLYPLALACHAPSANDPKLARFLQIPFSYHSEIVEAPSKWTGKQALAASYDKLDMMTHLFLPEGLDLLRLGIQFRFEILQVIFGILRRCLRRVHLGP